MSPKLVHSIGVQLSLLLAFASASIGAYVLYAMLALYYTLRYPLKQISKDVWMFVALYILMALVFIPIKVFDDLYILPKLSLGLSSLLLSFYFINDRDNFYHSVKLTVFIYQLLVVVAIAYFGFDDFPRTSPLEKIFEGKSGNGITSYLIVIQIAYIIFHTLVSSKGDTHLALSLFITLGISLSTYARGSLISAVFLILIYYTFIDQNRSFWLAVIIGFTLCITIYYESIEYFFFRYTKLSQGFSGDERIIAMNEYLGKINFITFFTGVDYSGTIIDNKLNGNPHNSFIRAHHNFGFFYVVINLLGISLFPLFYSRRRMLHVSLIIVLMFRIWTEPILLPTILDFYFFLIIFGISRYGKVKWIGTGL